MMEVIMSNGRNIDVHNPAHAGQVRADSDGRVVLVVQVVNTYPKLNTLKVMILKEGERGHGSPFKTIPMDFDDGFVLAKDYPYILNAKLELSYS